MVAPPITSLPGPRPRLAARGRATCTLAVAALALALAGCEGKGGAVSVRWRVVDQASGQSYDPVDLKVSNGSCCGNNNNHSFCSADNGWIIKTVSVVLEDPSGAAVDGGAGDFGLTPFPCSLREETTPFVLPEGTFAITLSVVNVDGAGDPQPVALPPPSVRTIVDGNVVNLDVIEIGVNPIPTK